MTKNKTAVKVGEVIRLAQQSGGIALYATADKKSSVAFMVPGPKVRVTKISFCRRDLRFNSVWLEVECTVDPTKRGWIAFDCGEWATKRIRIQSIEFVDAPQ